MATITLRVEDQVKNDLEALAQPRHRLRTSYAR